MREGHGAHMTQQQYQDYLRMLQKRLAERGELVEAGWLSLRSTWLPEDAPTNQVECCRLAFMAGAQYMFFSLARIMDKSMSDGEGQRLFDLINAEMQKFRQELGVTIGELRDLQNTE